MGLILVQEDSNAEGQLSPCATAACLIQALESMNCNCWAKCPEPVTATGEARAMRSPGTTTRRWPSLTTPSNPVHSREDPAQPKIHTYIQTLKEYWFSWLLRSHHNEESHDRYGQVRTPCFLRSETSFLHSLWNLNIYYIIWPLFLHYKVK